MFQESETTFGWCVRLRLALVLACPAEVKILEEQDIIQVRQEVCSIEDEDKHIKMQKRERISKVGDESVPQPYLLLPTAECPS